MSKSPVISCGVIVLSLALGACSSSSDGLMAQANLANANDDMCRSTGVPTGVAMLNGSQGAYAQCSSASARVWGASLRPRLAVDLAVQRRAMTISPAGNALIPPV